MIKKVDHIAIAVANLEEEVKRFRDVLGLEYRGSEEIPEQKVRVAFFTVGDLAIELLAPLSPDSPISQFLEKRGGGLHHVSLAVDSLHSQLSELRNLGVRMLDEKPRPGAHGTQIAFAHPKSFANVLIEFTQGAEKEK